MRIQTTDAELMIDVIRRSIGEEHQGHTLVMGSWPILSAASWWCMECHCYGTIDLENAREVMKKTLTKEGRPDLCGPRALLPEEAKLIAESVRCSKCDHLQVFHYRGVCDDESYCEACDGEACLG